MPRWPRARSRACSDASDLGPTGTIATIAAAGLRGRGGAGSRPARSGGCGPTEAAEALRRGQRLRRDPSVATDRTLMETEPVRGHRGPRDRRVLDRCAGGVHRRPRRATGGHPPARGAIGAAEDAGFIGTVRPRLRHERHDQRPARPGRLHARRGDGPAEGARGQARPARAAAAASAEVGLFDRPTVVQNVQTLALVPWILVNGAGGVRRDRLQGQPRHDPRPGPRSRPATASPRCRWARRSRHRRPGRRQRRPQGRPRRRPVGRPAAGRAARHAVRVRGAARGRCPHRLGLDRRRRQARLHRRPGPAADPVLRRRGLRQDDPVPDRDAPDQRDRRPDRDRPAEPTDLSSRRPLGRRRRRPPCATTSDWRPFRTRPGCDTSGASSTSTSFAAPAQPVSAARSPSRPAR